MTDLIGPASAPNATTTRPAIYRVFGAIDTWFKDCSTPASQDGTAYQADFFNGLLGQLRSLIRGNGNLKNGTGPVVPEVNTSDAMLLTAVQLLIARGRPNAGADTGSADALAVAPATPWPEYVAGARIWTIKSTAAGPNATAAPTLAVSGLAPVTIVRRDGSALLPGDLPAGIAFAAEFDGTYFRLVSLTWGEIGAAVQLGKWVYGAATGTGNAAAVTLFPNQAPVDGTEILVKWPAVNTAAAPTLNVAGVGQKTVVRQAALQIQPGDLAGYVPLIWDAANGWWRVNGFVQSDVLALIAANAPQIVTANITIYVDWQSGSDATGTGTQASPFQTIAKAIQYGNQRYYFGGFGLTVQLARPSTLGNAATYYAPPGYVATTPALTIRGDPSNQGNYVIGGTPPSGPGLVLVTSGFASLVGLTLIVQANSYHACGVSGGQLSVQNVSVQNTLTSAGSYSVFVAAPGVITVAGGCIINGGYWASVFSSSQGSSLNVLAGTTLTLTNATQCTGGFAVSQLCGTITAVGVTISGSGASNCGGPRYSATLNGVITTGGQGANFFPGNAAGTTATGGQYA